MGFRLRIRSRSALRAAALALLLAGLALGQPSISEAADPIANAGGLYSGDEGQQITFTGDAYLGGFTTAPGNAILGNSLMLQAKLVE